MGGFIFFNFSAALVCDSCSPWLTGDECMALPTSFARQHPTQNLSTHLRDRISEPYVLEGSQGPTHPIPVRPVSCSSVKRHESDFVHASSLPKTHCCILACPGVNTNLHGRIFHASQPPSSLSSLLQGAARLA